MITDIINITKSISNLGQQQLVADGVFKRILLTENAGILIKILLKYIPRCLHDNT